MAVLVTGGTGFVGSNIVGQLASQGREVIVLDVTAPDAQLEKFWANDRARIRFVRGDVSCVNDIEEAVQGTTVKDIVHAAHRPAMPSDPSEGLQQLVRGSVLGTINMLDIARSLPSVERFVYISSANIYGPTPESTSIVEDHPLEPITTYGDTKRASEALVRYAAGDSFSGVILRLGWIYGPMERPSCSRARMSTIWEVCHLAARGDQIDINDVEAIRDWTYSGDVGRIVHAVLTAGHLKHLVYNVSGGVGYSTRTVLSLLKARFSDLSYTEVSDEQANVVINTSNRRGPLDISRLTKDVAVLPSHDLASGLDAYLTWLSDMGEI
ncbi:NAD-dependent epimerase/dehydratase family protein [Candidatus Bipolaricaulota bacterium]